MDHGVAHLLLGGVGAFDQRQAELLRLGLGMVRRDLAVLGAALLDNRFFDPLSLPPEGPVRATVVVALFVAFVVWVRAQWSARRIPSGS